MRVLDKTVQMNEDFKPVLLITLELPLTLNGGGLHERQRLHGCVL